MKLAGIVNISRSPERQLRRVMEIILIGLSEKPNPRTLRCACRLLPGPVTPSREGKWTHLQCSVDTHSGQHGVSFQTRIEDGCRPALIYMPGYFPRKIRRKSTVSERPCAMMGTARLRPHLR